MTERSPATRGRRAAVTLAALASCACCAAVALALPPFTTAPKSSPPAGGGQAELFSIAAGCHTGFDRFVIRARFATPGYNMRYVAKVLNDASGLPVSLLGTKRLLVVVRPARGHTAGGAALLPNVLTPLCPNLRQIKSAGDFEGVVSFGLGLRKKQGFRVFRLTNPTRIVVDTAH